VIESDVLLRERYRIKHLLGQGGFGRTYLALDQERFDEPCVVKEFTVSYQDAMVVEKAKALFQREASILHQIQHPQIPKFWAAFEWEERLFLVQDYVPGRTYRELLKARSAVRRTFSEAEVLHLLRHLLPVLNYLHDRQIVHRDISPDNLVLQSLGVPGRFTDQGAGHQGAGHQGADHQGANSQGAGHQGANHQGANSQGAGHQGTDHQGVSAGASDNYCLGLPVLLDFGAVKEATGGLTSLSTMTRVGKVGYAPPEQLQTGTVQPHSDLYALAASCLVLLTGREPQQLLDGLTLDWCWQPYARLSDRLALVLERMLALHPGDRYASAQAVLDDLEGLEPGESLARSQGSNWLAGRSYYNAVVAETQMPRDAMPAKAVATQPKLHQRQPLIRQAKMTPQRLMLAGLLVTCGIGTWAVRQPLPSSHQVLGGETAAAAFRPSGERKSNEPKLIEFTPGEISQVKAGVLQESQPQVYRLRAFESQVMTAVLDGNARMTLLRAGGGSIDKSAEQTRRWTGQMPGSEVYEIQITGSGHYSLDLVISPQRSKAATKNAKTVPKQS
jgi:serine/threonine protein kinase